MSINRFDHTLLRLFCIMGPTCAGKSTLLQQVQERQNESVGVVEVGKVLRDKYPPSYFEGQGAPKKTREEAWDICVSGIVHNWLAGRHQILIDGQPRSLDQVHQMAGILTHLRRRLDADQMPHNVDITYIYLYCHEEVSMMRASKRDGNSPEKLNLALKRIDNDRQRNHDIILEFLKHNTPLVVVDTSRISDFTLFVDKLTTTLFNQR